MAANRYVSLHWAGSETSESKRQLWPSRGRFLKEKVLNAFGPPDFEDELAPKEPNRPCVGYEFMYYFQKPDETNHELKDKRIDVF